MVSDENIKEITHLIDSLRGYEKELNLTKYNETEKKVFLDNSVHSSKTSKM